MLLYEYKLSELYGIVNSFYLIVIVIWWLHSFDIIFTLFACGKHLHDRIISRRAVVLSLFIEVPVPNQENVGWSICVLCYLFCLFLWFFYWILKLFRDSSVFHLIVACNGIVASPGLSRRAGWKIGMHLNIKSFWSLKEAVSLYLSLSLFILSVMAVPHVLECCVRITINRVGIMPMVTLGWCDYG